MARKVGSVGDETARALRAAALELFARQGYAAVSMRAIAAKVGVQAAAIYNHFPTKQAILVALLKSHMEELLEAAGEALTAEGSPGERLDRFTRFHIQHHLPRADGVFVSYMELRSLEPEPFAAIERLRRRYEDALVAILEAGNRRGLLRGHGHPGRRHGGHCHADRRHDLVPRATGGFRSRRSRKSISTWWPEASAPNRPNKEAA